jgi:hypothetical protein
MSALSAFSGTSGLAQICSWRADTLCSIQFRAHDMGRAASPQATAHHASPASHPACTVHVQRWPFLVIALRRSQIAPPAVPRSPRCKAQRRRRRARQAPPRRRPTRPPSKLPRRPPSSERPSARQPQPAWPGVGRRRSPSRARSWTVPRCRRHCIWGWCRGEGCWTTSRP